MNKVIKHRLDVWEEEPVYWELVSAIDKRLYQSTLPKSLIELIKIRVSQINKCAYCIDYHTQDALRHGETPRRIFALSAWQESPLFSESERSALQVAEEMTFIFQHGISDQAYEKLRSYFTKKEIADIMICISHMNFLNRIGISTKTQAL
ncbi:carboxymuconolactone decarboxylase family protein [Dyadobacter sp. CY107]|uniref:carboxymuconolactone decarboxylase family protein n=1 Tax=Dyadobacter TaxID=120831 RepID=UPI001F35131D|nr:MULTISPECIES: carboxymuconolactone decarboxylase family protein [Dyadobacter]MCE7073785.1 carboxymuconolactone decarboxylase family protein [Dyadobacter sp. CY327]MCF2502141.1 carboxymuconolactone decarboxylase family protein [Dyadobacter fanqingshengii]